jgi:cell division ATPase FtsA
VSVPSGVSGLIDDIMDPSFASAIGLLLYGSKRSGNLSPSSSLPSFSEIGRKIPIKGIAGKIGNFVKSFLP